MYLFKRLLTIAVICFTGLSSFAQGVKESSSRKEVYAVGKESTLEVENKYGTILIVPWKKDSVQIEADIFLQAKNYAKLRKLKSDIRVSFAGTSNYIIAETHIGSGGSKVASEIRTLTNTLSPSSTVEINYTVYLPKYLNLVLSNKFGDIYIDEMLGDVDIELSNGVIKANQFHGNADLNLMFAKGNIREMGTARLDLSYTELEVGVVEQLDFTGKSSDLEIDTAGVVKIESRRDDISLGEVEYLYGNSSFSEIIVNDFIREADCEMKYGSLKIENVLPGFSRINLNSDYADIMLYVPYEDSYLVDILYNDRAVVNLPEQYDILERRRSGEDYFNLEGSVGQRVTDHRLSIKADNKCYINISTRKQP